MKIILSLFVFASTAYASTPLEMKYGYWEYKTDLSSTPMMKQAMASLKNLPKAQREQIMKKMGAAGGVQKNYQCFCG